MYHIQLIDHPVPIIHPSCTIPVYILLLYKEELDKMIVNNIITAVTKPIDQVNSIVCNIRETPEGKKKIRLCLDPNDLNKNIHREHYYTRTIQELLQQLHGKKFLPFVNSKKGYWHIALDHESSLLCTLILIPPSDSTILNDYPSVPNSPKTSANADLMRCTDASLMSCGLLMTLRYAAQPNQSTIKPSVKCSWPLATTLSA